MAVPIPSMTGGAAGPSSNRGESAFDSSAWNVNFAEGSIESSKSDSLGQYLPYLLIGAGLLIVWRFTRKN